MTGTCSENIRLPVRHQCRDRSQGHGEIGDPAAETADPVRREQHSPADGFPLAHICFIANACYSPGMPACRVFDDGRGGIRAAAIDEYETDVIVGTREIVKPAGVQS